MIKKLPDFPVPRADLASAEPRWLAAHDKALRHLGTLTTATFHLWLSRSDEPRTQTEHYQELRAAAGVSPEVAVDTRWHNRLRRYMDSATRLGFLASGRQNRYTMTPGGRRATPFAAFLSRHWLTATDDEQRVLPEAVTRPSRNGYRLAVAQATLEPASRFTITRSTGLTIDSVDYQLEVLLGREVVGCYPPERETDYRTFMVQPALQPAALNVLRQVHSLGSPRYRDDVGAYTQRLLSSEAFPEMMRLTMPGELSALPE